MKSRAGLENSVRKILVTQEVAVLATQGQEYPHACLVAFVAAKDLKQLYFVTGKSTRKFKNLQHDGRVMMLVDDRSNTVKDFDTATVITGRGQAIPMDKEDADEMLSVYLARHPHLERFARDEDSSMVRVDIDTYAVVTRFQEVLVLEMGTGPGKP